MKNEYIKELIDGVRYNLFENKIDGDRHYDEIWINPRSYHLGQKHFCEVRELCKPLGIRLEYIEYPMLDNDHHWYFIREGEEDPTGWLKYRREIP